MKVYVASSWRNLIQQSVVETLRDDGHDVYDFKNPGPNDKGFGWTSLGMGTPKEWTADQFVNQVLYHPAAKHGFSLDMNALEACDACVLVLPCGRSAHLELGYAVGRRKLTCVYIPALDEPELMYRMCDYVETTMNGVRLALAANRPFPRWQKDILEYDDDLRAKGSAPEVLSPRDTYGGHVGSPGPCRPYRHRECHTCGGCWRHGACECSPTIMVAK